MKAKFSSDMTSHQCASGFRDDWPVAGSKKCLLVSLRLRKQDGTPTHSLGIIIGMICQFRENTDSLVAWRLK